jgi:probable phosphoglycerate mutase
MAQIERLFRLDGEDAAELVLVRHAQPECGLPVRRAPLSGAGRLQAEQLAAMLCWRQVEAVYTAPELVALQTAEPLSRAIDRDMVVVPDLHEIEAQPYLDELEIDRCFEMDLSQRFTRRPRWDSLPGFETSRGFRSRAIQALEAIVARHPSRRVVVVAHASAINAYISMVLDVQRDVMFMPDYASLSTVRSAGDHYAVRALNQTDHLRETAAAFAHERAFTARSPSLTGR